MTTVAITGITGILGRALAEGLERDPQVTRVVGLARRPFDPVAEGLSKVTYHEGDVSDPDSLDAAFAGVDSVCHLAFTVLDRGIAPEQAELVNVEGSGNVFAAAARAGAGRLVYASSIAAYGAHPDNPPLLGEDHPVRGNEDFYYGRHKAQVETILDAFESRHPDVAVVRLRPCVVVGPRSIDLFRGPVPTPLVGLVLSPLVPWALPDPGFAPLQLVHEDDVAEAFRLALTAPRARGAYNIAGGGQLTGPELASELRAIRLPVPRALARRVVDVAYRARISPAGSPWVDMARHPILVDTRRAREELGWVPRWDTRTALRDMLERFRRAAPLARFLTG